MPKISVILATYNGDATLPRAVESILNQILKDIELIIVNDGATDSTQELLRDYANKDSRIQIITQENAVLALQEHFTVRVR